MTKKKTEGRPYPPPKTETLKPHAIVDISYSKDFIECACGWKGKTTEHDAHRKAA